MNIKGKLALVVGLFFVFTSFYPVMALITEPPKQILKAADVKHFIKTFPLLKKDFEKYDGVYELELKEGNVTMPEALKANQEFLGILKKHGWDEHFFTKYPAIVWSYAYIVHKKELKKAESKMEDAIKKIQENPALSDEMKKQMKKQMMEQMKAARGMMKTQGDMYFKRLHPKDIELVRPFVQELKKVFDDNRK